MVFKCLHKMGSQYLRGLICNFKCTSYILQNNVTVTDLRLPKKRSSNGQRSFSCRRAKNEE